MSWRTAITLALLVGAVLSGIAVWQTQLRLKTEAPDAAAPDYVLHDFTIVALNATGARAFTLRAPLLERNPNDHSMTLQTPTFTFPDKQNRAWEATSKTAWVADGADEVRLRGDVHLRAPDGHNKAELRSEKMNVFPQQNRAVSDDLVTVTQPGVILRGRGFEALMDQDRVTLKSEVRAQYDPNVSR